MMSASGVRVSLPRDEQELHPEGDACRDDRAAAVAARLVDVLRAPGRGQGAAVRVRPSLLRAGHRGGAGRLPVRVPAQRPRLRTRDVPDRQRGGRRNPRRGNGIAAAEPADDGAAAHRPAARAARSRRGRRTEAADAAGAGGGGQPDCAALSSAIRSRPPNRSARWPRSSTSTR